MTYEPGRKWGKEGGRENEREGERMNGREITVTLTSWILASPSLVV